MKKLAQDLLLIALACVVVFGSAFANQSIQLNNSPSGVTLLKQDQAGLTLQMEIGKIDFYPISTPEGNFTLMSIDGFARSQKIGEPSLPLANRLISIPFNADMQTEVLNYEIQEISLADLGITDPIIPVQPSLSKSQDPSTVPFEYKQDIYQRAGYYRLPLSSSQNIGIMRSLNLGLVSLSPIEYNPGTKTLRVYKKMTVKVTYIHPDYSLTESMQKRYYSPFFEPAYSQVINYERSSSIILNDITRYPVKFLIISHRMFQTQLQPFIEWKTKQGYKVIAAYTDSIGTTNTAIKNYIHAIYDQGIPSDPAPSFVLLVGDAQQIPPFQFSGHISDLSFCEFTGDHIPEIYYGRWSAQTTALLQPQIDKTLEYERYLIPDPSYLGRVTMIAGVDANYAPTYGNGQINYGTNLYFNAAHGITSNTWLYPASDDPGASAAIIQTVNSGVGFINYTAHGSHDGWADPSFSTSNVNSLTNIHKYTTAVGNCCLTSTFGTDYGSPCVGEAWLQAANKGAVGYIGASNSSYWDEDYWWGIGYGPVNSNPTYGQNGIGAYDGTFHDHGEQVTEHYVTNDAMNFCGNLAVTESGSSLTNYYWEVYHVFGDPSLSTFMGVPTLNNVTHPPIVLITATSVSVQATPASYVGISVNGVLHGAAYVDQSGTVDVPLTPFTGPGTADIIVTAQNKIPYVSTIQIITPTGPYVVFDTCIVNDASGNNNGLIDCGENILLGVQLINVGPNNANNVTAALSSADTFVVVTDSTESYGTIPGNNGVVNRQNAFAFGVSPRIPDGHNISFTLTVSGTALDTWVSNISLPAHAPILSFASVSIDDGSGNNNGILDPGENATLVVTLNNTGSGQANSVTAVLSENDPFVNVTDANGSFGNIAPAGSGNNNADRFSVTASPTCPMGHSMTFHLEINGGGTYTTGLNFNIVVGDRVVFFNDDFSANLGWTGLGGSAQWTISAAIGGSGSHGPDPAQDHSPSTDNKVLGNNLTSSCDYAVNISATRWITSPTIDCSNYTGVILNYFHWLGIETNSYDHAYLQVFNGTTWIQLYENPGTSLDEQAWNGSEYDVSASSDNNANFKIRFGLGSTDGSVQYCGWNIDDIALRGYNQGSSGNPHISFDPGSIADSMSQGDQIQKTIRIHNTGDAILRVALSTTNAWLEFEPGQRSIDPLDSIDFVVNVNCADLAPGSHSGTIDYTSNDTDHPSGTIPATIFIYAPHIDFPQRNVADTLLSGQQSSVPFIIRNTGVGRLIYGVDAQTDGRLSLAGKRSSKIIKPLALSKPIGYRITDTDKSASNEPLFPPIILNSGGPDAFGYKWIDSDEPGGPAFGWIDISGNGTPVTLTDDSFGGPFPIGFNFPFYENTYSDIYIGSNGLLTFGGGSSSLSNTNLPTSATPNNLIALWWDDLNPGAGGNIYYYFDSANGRFIISFAAVPNYNSGGGGTGSLSCQAIFYQSGKLVLQYGTMDPGLDTDGLNGATVGIENSTGTIGLPVVFNAAYMHDNLAIKISSDEWLEADPISGTIEPGARDTVSVLFNATDLADSEYTGHLVITANDPADPSTTMPVILWVGQYNSGCYYVPGDANGNGAANGLDVIYLVNYFKGGDQPPDSCQCRPPEWLYVACDVSGDCSRNGLDVTYMVNYYKGGPALGFCADCPPAIFTSHGQEKPIAPTLKTIEIKKNKGNSN